MFTIFDSRIYTKLLKGKSAQGMSGATFNDYVKGQLEDASGVYVSPTGTDTMSCDWAPGEEDEQAEGLTQQDIRSRHYQCLPGFASDAIFRSDLAHENAHQETCQSRNADESWDRASSPSPYKAYMDDMENYEKDEVKAYDAKIRILCGAW